MEDLKDVPHSFVEVELDGDAGLVEGLVVPHGVAEEDFLGAGLDQRRGEALGVVAVDGET